MEYVGIQYLRGLAATMIVLYHLRVPLERLGYRGPWPEWLASGVDIFFVVSGFIMWITTFRAAPSPGQFYRKRIVRIVPLYWLLTTIIVIVLLVIPSAVNSGQFEFYHVLTSYLFIPSVHPVTAEYEPVLIAGWTLNYEMFFYLIFGGALLLAPARRLAVTLVILCAVVALGWMQGAQKSVLSFYGQPLILEFALGVCLGAAVTAQARMHGGLALLMAAAGFIAIPAIGIIGVSADRFFVYGLPAAMIVAGAVFSEFERDIPNISGMKILGDASYSIYLSHGIILSLVGQVWIRLGLTSLKPTGLWFSVAAVCAALIIGVTVYRFVETPMIRLMSGSRRGDLQGTLSSVRS